MLDILLVDFLSFFPVRKILFPSIEICDASDGTLANRTEIIHFVDSHTANLRRTVTSLALVARPLEHTNLEDGIVEFLLLLLISDILMIRKFGKRRRNLHALWHHIRPLALEILQRGKVRFPRLGIARIHRVVLIGTVLIAQARIAMTELMYQHLLERRMI